MSNFEKRRIGELKNEFGVVKTEAELFSLLEVATTELAPAAYEKVFNRNGAKYIEGMEGLGFLFKFIKTKAHKSVLDAGTGSGKGIVELSKTLGEGLDIYGVGFGPKENEIPINLRNHFVLGDFESLRGIKAGTPGDIISHHGVFEYSKHPGLVIHKANRLLASHGIIKVASTIDNTDMTDQERQQRLDLFKFYTQGFKKLGYSVADVGLDDVEPSHEYRTGLFLAIKPGEGKIYTDSDANNLLMVDSFHVEEQLALHSEMLEPQK